MKKVWSLLLACFFLVQGHTQSQAPDSIFGNKIVILNLGNWTFAGTSRSDSIFNVYKTYGKWFKPMIPYSLTFTSFPSAVLYPGATLYATDSLKPYFSNGTAWLSFGGSTGGTQTLQGVITTGNLMTGNNTVALAGNSFTFSVGTRNRTFNINPADSALDLTNFGLKYIPDSITTTSNAYYPAVIKTATTDPRGVDFTWGRGFAVQASQTPTETTTFGDNLAPNGAQISASLSSIGLVQQYNNFNGSNYHHYWNIRYISTASKVIDMLKADVVPATNAVTTTIAANTFNVNNAQASAAAVFPTMMTWTQNNCTLQGSGPILFLFDTAFGSNKTQIKQNGPDLQLIPGRNFTLNASANGVTFTAGFISLNSAINGVHQGSPTAQLHIGAGSTTAQTAPLKFTSGPLMTTTETGAVEYNGTHYFGTIGSTRFQFDQADLYSTDGTLGGNRIVSQANNSLTFSGGAVKLTGAQSGTPFAIGDVFSVGAITFTDNNTAASGTVSDVALVGIGSPTMAASNTAVTYTNASTLYVNGPPAAGTNATITNAYAFRVGGGKSLFGGDILLPHTIYLGSTPGIAAGTGAGTSPTISISGTDVDGDVTVTTGVTPSATAAVVTITFASGYAYPSHVYPTITAGNALTAALTGVTMVYATGGTSTWVINSGTSGLTGAVTYLWHYHIAGN